jgi:hypothetical protein
MNRICRVEDEGHAMACPFCVVRTWKSGPSRAAQKRTSDAGLQPQWLLSVYFFSVGRKSNAAEFMQ